MEVKKRKQQQTEEIKSDILNLNFYCFRKSKGQDNELFVYKMKVSENDVTRTGVHRIGNVESTIFKFLIVKWKQAAVGYF